MKVTWSNVPEDATHYQPQQQAFYKRVSWDEWYVWSKDDTYAWSDRTLKWLKCCGCSDSGEWEIKQP